jgi:hypothetical protein
MAVTSLHRRSRADLVRGVAAAAAAAALAGCSAGPINVITIDPNSLTTGLVAHWPFDDGAGTVLTDRSGYGRDGAVIGGTWIAGRFGGALHFDAGEVTVPSFPQPGTSWSVAGWVRPPTGDFGTSYVTLISAELLFAGGWELNAKLTPAEMVYQFGYWIGPGDSDYVFYDCHCVTAGEWTHLAGVVDGAAHKMSFYRNGILQAERAAPRPILPGSPTLYMARWAMPDRLYAGDLDDFAIYSRALAPREVELLTSAPVPDVR